MSDVQPIDLDDLQRAGVLVRKLTDDNWLADMVEIAAAEIARLREERRWVPVGERLPTVQGEDVLTLSFFSDGSPLVCLGWHNGREWMQYHGRGPGLPVTHWQPLPPGPEVNG